MAHDTGRCGLLLDRPAVRMIWPRERMASPGGRSGRTEGRMAGRLASWLAVCCSFLSNGVDDDDGGGEAFRFCGCADTPATDGYYFIAEERGVEGGVRKVTAAVVVAVWGKENRRIL